MAGWFAAGWQGGEAESRLGLLLRAALELYRSAPPTEELRARLGPEHRSPELSHTLGGWRLR